MKNYKKLCLDFQFECKNCAILLIIYTMNILSRILFEYSFDKLLLQL